MTDIKGLPLSCLLRKERTKDTEQVRQDLENRGWTFLYKDDKVKLEVLPNTEKVTKYLGNINKGFFNLDQKAKDGYRQVVYPTNRFGYFSTGRKEGYRFATGTKLREFVLPCINRLSHVYAPFHIIAAACDEICLQILQNQGHYIFNVTDVNSSKTTKNSYRPSHISLLKSPFHHNFDKIDQSGDRIKDDSKHCFGLFDIVKYRPKSQFPEEFSSTDSQVDEHADPGLFSISLASTAPGLEMFDPNQNSWISVPLNVMVLWCGHAVTDVSGGKIKTGIHRVVANEEERLTCWYEVCVDEQMPKRDLDNMSQEAVEMERELWIRESKVGISMSKSILPRGPVLKIDAKRKGLDSDDIARLMGAKNK